MSRLTRSSTSKQMFSGITAAKPPTKRGTKRASDTLIAVPIVKEAAVDEVAEKLRHTAFKKRAEQVRSLLKDSGVDGGVSVSINAEKPRKGCFEIIANGETVISLLGMPRPFKDLKALDMEEVVKNIVDVLQK